MDIWPVIFNLVLKKLDELVVVKMEIFNTIDCDHSSLISRYVSCYKPPAGKVCSTEASFHFHMKMIPPEFHAQILFYEKR